MSMERDEIQMTKTTLLFRGPYHLTTGIRGGIARYFESSFSRGSQSPELKERESPLGGRRFRSFTWEMDVELDESRHSMNSRSKGP